MAIKQTNFRLAPQTLHQLDAYQARQDTTNRTQKLKDLVEDMHQLLIQGMTELRQWFTPEELEMLLQTLSRCYAQNIPTVLTPHMVQWTIQQTNPPLLSTPHAQEAFQHLSSVHTQLLIQWLRWAQHEAGEVPLERLPFLSGVVA